MLVLLFLNFFQGTNPLQRVIDFDVIRTRLGSSHSLATSGRGDFQERLAARDLCCTMTGLPLYTASHIIPHSRGDEVSLFKTIIESQIQQS